MSSTLRCDIEFSISRMLAFLHSTLALTAFDLIETRCSLCSKGKDCEQLNPIISIAPSHLRASAYKSNTTFLQLYWSSAGLYCSENRKINDSLKLITLCKLSSARSDFIIFIPSTNSFSIESEFLWNISPLHRSNFESGAFSWRKQSKRWKRRTKVGSWREKWMGSQFATRFFTWESLTIFYEELLRLCTFRSVIVQELVLDGDDHGGSLDYSC